LIVAFRFVHAADIHLDSPLQSLALRDAALADLIGTATRQALVRTIDICLDEQVDALILAGDLYDGSQTSMKTARFLADQIGRLDAAGIQTFIIRGNHDAMSKITPELVFPDSVKLYRGHAEAVLVQRSAADLPIYVHGVSFAQPHAPESLLGKYKPAVAGALNIGLLHTSLGGAVGHDRYAPCSVAELRATGFDYWALGHIHSRAVDERAGAGTIVMPGMPQGRDIGEAGAKSVTLVTIRDDRSVMIEERFTSVAQFERLSIDVTAMSEWPELVGRIGRGLADARSGVTADHLVVRVRLTGRTVLAWQIRRDRDLLRAEMDRVCESIGACWIEQLEIGCAAPDADASVAGHALGELGGLIDRNIIGTPAFLTEVAAIAADLLDQLPPECRKSFGADEAARDALLAALADEGVADVLARLHGASVAKAE
jgi:exonuclease SbcD